MPIVLSYPSPSLVGSLDSCTLLFTSSRIRLINPLLSTGISSSVDASDLAFSGSSLGGSVIEGGRSRPNMHQLYHLWITKKPLRFGSFRASSLIPLVRSPHVVMRKRSIYYQV